MNTFFMTVIIGVSLSMDAFSLALIYGTQGINRRSELLLSFIVGMFHFVMPLIGLFFGNLLFDYYSFDIYFIVGLIFGVIGIEMIISSGKEDNNIILNSFWSYLLFGFSVSIDSFTTGIGINAINSDYYLVSFIFMIISGLFTYLGVRFGNCLSDRFGKNACVCGGACLIILGIFYLFK